MVRDGTLLTGRFPTVLLKFLIRNCSLRLLNYKKPLHSLYAPAELKLPLVAGRLTGTFVSVCDSATGRCQECGQTKYVGPGQWSPIQCPRGVQGNSVKFVTPNNFFQACEVEIFGEGKTFTVFVKQPENNFRRLEKKQKSPGLETSECLEVPYVFMFF